LVAAFLRESSSLAGQVVHTLTSDQVSHNEELMALPFRSLTFKELSDVTWRLARLSRTDLPGVRQISVAKVSEAALEQMELDTSSASISEITAMLWSMASLSVQVDLTRFTSISARLATSSLTGLANLAWAVATLGCDRPAEDLLLAFQEELLRRCTWKMQLGSGPQATAEALLTVLWSATFAGLLQERVRSAVHQFLLQEIVPQFDELGGDLLPLASTSASQEAEDPKINMDLGDRLVIYKPPGWEVDTTISPGPSSGRLLSAFLRDVLPLGPVGASHQFGFLHRLDLPSSGLILVAKSHQAFYDLQLQLSTGTLQRDYMVLCHGWVSKQRHEIRAKVHWWKVLGLSNAPSAVLRSGRASVTFLQRLQRTQLALSSACSLLAIRIGTGRRHQIRLHTAHVGHPVVADSQYAAKKSVQNGHQMVSAKFSTSIFPHFFGSGP